MDLEELAYRAMSHGFILATKAPDAGKHFYKELQNGASTYSRGFTIGYEMGIQLINTQKKGKG